MKKLNKLFRFIVFVVALGVSFTFSTGDVFASKADCTRQSNCTTLGTKKCVGNYVEICSKFYCWSGVGVWVNKWALTKVCGSDQECATRNGVTDCWKKSGSTSIYTGSPYKTNSSSCKAKRGVCATYSKILSAGTACKVVGYSATGKVKTGLCGGNSKTVCCSEIK